ncbi:MAG: helix-turn-helix domain-containing protein [Bacteroidetes bacterium]|nr:helix-turn-helix domain-containing protein [Bacteroidota bacterium]MCH8522986.1 helix-turn-helix domain-containing protein [Balneolales bacterium]
MASLNEDLLAIRNKKQLKQSDIFEKTRIPLNIIDEIERGTIFTNKSHQLTYIRSYVRSYAKAIGVAEDDIIEALDEQKNEGYSGILYTRYLADPSDLSTVDGGRTTQEESAETQDSEVERKASGSDSTVTKGGNEYSRPDPKRDYNQTTPPPPEMESVDWAGVGKRVTGSNNKAVVYTGLATAVLLSAGLFYYLLLFSPEDEIDVATTEELTTPVVPDELQVDTEDPQTVTQPEVTPIPPPAQLTPSAPVRPSTTPAVTGAVPDTVRVILHAAGGVLEPVRVTSDINNTRSPYWIEDSQAMNFEFIDNIIIEGQISRVAVWINGHHFVDLMEYATGSRIIELSREALIQYPEMFSSAGDTTSQTIDPPSVINERPQF